MPLAKNLNKVRKKVSSGTGAVHPKGRKYKQLTRAELRTQKLATDKSKRHQAKEDKRKSDLLL
jgi:translation machinery-associated protein 16